MTIEQAEEPLARLGLLREGEEIEGTKKHPDQAALDIEAARLRGKRLSYREIGERMGCSQSAAHARVQRAYKAARADATDVAREFERERLDKLYRKAEEVASKTHYVTAHGKVVAHPETGQPLEDPMPVLAAYKEMRSIAESYRKLEGLDQPTKVEQTGTVKYEVVGVELPDLG
jgi:DNA-binding Lrp family transcriptional regulator